MPVTRLQYFSIAVHDLEAAAERYTKMLGLTRTSEFQDTRWGFRNCMLGIGDNNVIELISPSSPDSALARFMKMREGDAYPGGEGLYLVGFQVDDVKSMIASAEGVGARVTTEAESPRSAWVHPASNGNVMLEFNEAAPPA